jgi:purine-nucleoside phosphorylase
MWQQIQQTVSFIQQKISFVPEVGVILGSGLGSFIEDIQIVCIIPYEDIPNFPMVTVKGHKGALVFGTGPVYIAEPFLFFLYHTLNQVFWKD